MKSQKIDGYIRTIYSPSALFSLTEIGYNNRKIPDRKRLDEIKMKLKYKDSKLAQVQSDFRNYYKTNLKDDFIRLEKERIPCLKKFWLYFSISVLIIGAFVWYDGADIMRKNDMRIFLTLLVVSCIVCHLPISGYKTRTKMTVMAKILAFWKNFSVHKKGKGLQVTKDIIERSGLFGNFNETETDDNFSGTYDGVDVCISEQEVIYRGRKMSHTHFKGVFILLKWDKKLAKKTIARSRDLVIPGGLMGSYCFIAVGLMPLVIAAPFLINWISGNGRIDIMLLFMCFLPAAIYLTVLYFILFYKWKKNESGGGSLFPVILEDPLFRKKWSVISNDQIEARVILTPRFMERLKAVKNYFHGNRIDCSFFGNSVLIAVYTTKDMFETTSVFTSSLNYHKMYEVVTQMYSVFSVISEINGKKFNN